MIRVVYNGYTRRHEAFTTQKSSALGAVYDAIYSVREQYHVSSHDLEILIGPAVLNSIIKEDQQSAVYMIHGGEFRLFGLKARVVPKMMWTFKISVKGWWQNEGKS